MTKSLVWFVVATMALLSGGCRVAGAADPMAGPSPEQQAAPQEQAAAEPPATSQQVAPEQQAAAEKLGLPVVITNSIGMKLVLIPPGEFLMGSPESDELANGNEKPQHRVRIMRPFYLGIHETTQEEYGRVMAVNPSGFRGAQYPMENLSWDDAVAFCDKLSAIPEEKTAGRKCRLPTEAEWEYACRAGSTTRFSFGESDSSLADYAWFGRHSRSSTHPVGGKRSNPWGLYDMHGNVWEWCGEWFDNGYYRNSPPADPMGPIAGSGRVYRAGGWSSPASSCRSALRFANGPYYRDSRLGFRVAAVPSGSPASSAGPASDASSDSR